MIYLAAHVSHTTVQALWAGLGVVSLIALVLIFISFKRRRK